MVGYNTLSGTVMAGKFPKPAGNGEETQVSHTLKGLGPLFFIDNGMPVCYRTTKAHQNALNGVPPDACLCLGYALSHTQTPCLKGEHRNRPVRGIVL